MKPLDLAKLNVQIYASPDGWVNYWQTDDVSVGHAIIEDQHVLVLRGSVTAEDWLRDFDAVPDHHPKLGWVHAGFAKGMDDVYSTVKPVVGANVIITGHSLGAARARILAALFAADKIPVAHLCVFGSPKPGFEYISTLIQNSGMIHESFRNLNDPVTEVPFTLPLLTYCHPEPYQHLNAPPVTDEIGHIHDHSIALYVQGLSTRENANPDGA